MPYGDEQIDGYTEGEDPVVFHYKQGTFREREDSRSRDMATGKSAMKRGLFRVLVSTKQNRMVFIAMIVCFLLVLMINLLQGDGSSGTLGGTTVKLSAFSFDDAVYASVEIKSRSSSRAVASVWSRLARAAVSHATKKDGEEDADPVEMTAVFQAVDGDGDVSDKAQAQVVFVGRKDYLRARFSDYDIARVLCDVRLGDEVVSLSCKVDKR